MYIDIIDLILSSSSWLIFLVFTVDGPAFMLTQPSSIKSRVIRHSLSTPSLLEVSVSLLHSLKKLASGDHFLSNYLHDQSW